MNFNIYSVITIITFLGYGFFILQAHFVIKKLSSQVNVPKHWSGRISIVELKKLMLLNNDVNVIKEANRAILYIRLSRFMGYGGALLFVILMLVNAN